MPIDPPNIRIESALDADSPFDALMALARAFKAGGMSQREMYDLFDRYRAKHEDDSDETMYNAILDAMDFIGGWCDASQRIFETDSQA